MHKTTKNAYQLLLASRSNIRLHQQDYLLIWIISTIGHQLKHAIDLCDTKSTSDYFISKYKEERQSIIYESDINDEESMNDELNRHEESNERDLNHHHYITSNFKDGISEIFSQIFDLLCIKYTIDDNFYFLEKIIGEANCLNIPIFAAACSGLTIDDFIEADCLELYDDIRSNDSDKITYADVYEDFCSDLKIISNYLDGGIKSIKIEKNFDKKILQSLEFATAIELATEKKQIKESNSIKLREITNERLKQIDDEINDIPF